MISSFDFQLGVEHSEHLRDVHLYDVCLSLVEGKRSESDEYSLHLLCIVV